MMVSQRFTMKGFTLIEVMIVVAIIGILAAIAYPSYDEYIKRGHRSEGMAQLNDIAARQERYYAQAHTYITASADLDKLGLTVSSGKVESATGKYAVTVDKVDKDGGYTLTATQNFGDTKCGNLTLNALGTKDRSGSGKTINDCWK
ncbi:MAG TPA: pilus assembly protein PilE [Pseudomonas sp.]|nr:pilus assembly protein PilE [Pseudomonas sp.]